MTKGWESQDVLGRCPSCPGQESSSFPKGQPGRALLVGDPAHADKKAIYLSGVGDRLKKPVPHSLKSEPGLF